MSGEFALVTVHPKFVDSFRSYGVMRTAEAKNIASYTVTDLRNFAADKHGSVDAAPYGGGDGMVMRPDCLASAVEAQRLVWGRPGKVILTSPSGKLWTQREAEFWAAAAEPMIFVCGRFAGVDQRFIDTYVDEEYSIGDVILAGGELPALTMLESILRLIPGVLGNDDSARCDSFGEGMSGLLEYPLYTRPPEWQGHKVPEVLLSGRHADIAAWRSQESMRRTADRRPDLLLRR